MFSVDGYEINPNIISCTYPDYKRKNPCKHFYEKILQFQSDNKVEDDHKSRLALLNTSAKALEMHRKQIRTYSFVCKRT
jgi:hypothetical protein